MLSLLNDPETSTSRYLRQPDTALPPDLTSSHRNHLCSAWTAQQVGRPFRPPSMTSPSVVRPGACCERCRAAKFTLVALSLVWATPACAAPAATPDVLVRDGSGDMADAGPAAVAVWVSVLFLISLNSVVVYGNEPRTRWWPVEEALVWRTTSPPGTRCRDWATFRHNGHDVQAHASTGLCQEDRKSTRLNSSHSGESRMPSSA